MHDFEGCVIHAQVDFVINHTNLCISIAKAVRERFGLRKSQRERREALANADAALANWYMMLPSSLQLRSSNTGTSAAALHLAYNNILILLHRPHPREVQQHRDSGSNDGDICGAAAVTIVNVLEDLRNRDGMACLWLSEVNALFTAMVQISVELRLKNPILAISALRRFDSGLCSLQKLAQFWSIAEPILTLFRKAHMYNMACGRSKVHHHERRPK